MCRTPQYLYKYFSNIDYAIEAIENNSLHFSEPSDFNDIFDCAVTIEDELHDFPCDEQKTDVIKLYIKDRYPDHIVKVESENHENMGALIKDIEINNTDINVDLIKKDILMYLKNIKPNEMLIYCLTEVADSLLMWAHYGESLKGCCLCIDTQKNKKILSNAKKVKYTPTRCSIFSGDKLISKSVDWKYEKEWRILHHTKDKQRNKCKISGFDSIIIGERMSLEYRLKLIDLAVKNKITIYEARADKKKYKINIEFFLDESVLPKIPEEMINERF